MTWQTVQDKSLQRLGLLAGMTGPWKGRVIEGNQEELEWLSGHLRAGGWIWAGTATGASERSCPVGGVVCAEPQESDGLVSGGAVKVPLDGGSP